VRIGLRSRPFDSALRKRPTRVDGSLVDLCGLTPRSVEQLGAREDSARLFQKTFQQAELYRSEIDVARAASHPARLGDRG
jgi:hypothetical protein